jgi:hypothetical protein
MSSKISAQRASHACDLAKEIIEQLVLDGNDHLVIYSVFAIGLAANAHTMGLDVETYLSGCEAAYKDLQK